MGENVNSNLIMLPNAPSSGSDMLSEMTASFIASQQMGEAMSKKSEQLQLEKAKEKLKR